MSPRLCVCEMACVRRLPPNTPTNNDASRRTRRQTTNTKTHADARAHLCIRCLSACSAGGVVTAATASEKRRRFKNLVLSVAASFPCQRSVYTGHHATRRQKEASLDDFNAPDAVFACLLTARRLTDMQPGVSGRRSFENKT